MTRLFLVSTLPGLEREPRYSHGSTSDDTGALPDDLVRARARDLELVGDVLGCQVGHGVGSVVEDLGDTAAADDT